MSIRLHVVSLFSWALRLVAQMERLVVQEAWLVAMAISLQARLLLLKRAAMKTASVELGQFRLEPLRLSSTGVIACAVATGLVRTALVCGTNQKAFFRLALFSVSGVSKNCWLPDPING